MSVPLDLGVFRDLFVALTEEMGVVLQRTAHSPNVVERRDYSCALYDAAGTTIAMGDHMPVHLGSMPLSVAAARDALDLAPGDVALVNDPASGGTHLPDLTLIQGVWLDGREEVAFWLANRAHHADVGGRSAGSMPLSSDVYEEGVVFPPVRLMRGGEPVESMWRHLLADVRTPAERAGDLAAQLASLATGERRLRGLVDRYGFDRVRRMGAELVEYAARLVRGLLEEIPDGVHGFEDALDDDGLGTLDPTVRVTIEIAGGGARIDFAGTDPAVEGPLNANPAIVRSAVFYVVRALLDEDAPANDGILAPLEIVVPEGSLLSPGWGRPVAAGNVETSQRVVDVLLGALSAALPGRIPEPGDDEQPRAGRDARGRAPVHLLRDGGRWSRRTSGRPGSGGSPHPHDQQPEHARRGARTGAPGPGAALRLPARQRRGRPPPGGRRADPRDRSPRPAGGDHPLRPTDTGAVGAGGGRPRRSRRQPPDPARRDRGGAPRKVRAPARARRQGPDRDPRRGRMGPDRRRGGFRTPRPVDGVTIRGAVRATPYRESDPRHPAPNREEPMTPSAIPLHVAVFGPAAEFVDVVPSDASVECVFVPPDTAVGDEALSPQPRFVILDLDYVGEEADRILAELGALAEVPRIVAVTRDPSTESAVQALTGGAAEYYVFPGDRDRIAADLETAKIEFRGGEKPREDEPETLPGFPEMVARCEAMRGVLGVVRKVIESGANTVLIRGETGTGKELVARAIHYQSAQHDRPFIEVNCTAIPENLLEAELFGYEAGAFTDAKTSKPGMLQLADGGTLFLDELGDMSLNLQGKLLRAIEEKRFRRLGGTKEVSVSMRIIAATSRNLEQAIGQGLFRSDLYYRLNVVAVELPPLREREADVELLADHFAARYAEQYGKPVRPLSQEARGLLRSYQWPGNVRELKNTIERAVLLGEGPEITLRDLAPSVGTRRKRADELDQLVIEMPPEGLPFDEFERRVISHALKRNEWNKSQTARELEISRPRLLRKIEKYDLEPTPAPS